MGLDVACPFVAYVRPLSLPNFKQVGCLGSVQNDAGRYVITPGPTLFFLLPLPDSPSTPPARLGPQPSSPAALIEWTPRRNRTKEGTPGWEDGPPGDRPQNKNPKIQKNRSETPANTTEEHAHYAMLVPPFPAPACPECDNSRSLRRDNSDGKRQGSTPVCPVSLGSAQPVSTFRNSLAFRP